MWWESQGTIAPIRSYDLCPTSRSWSLWNYIVHRLPKYEKYYRIREGLSRSPCWLLKHWKNTATVNITHGNCIEANKRAKVCDNLVNLIRPRWFMSKVNEWREPNHEWVTRTELLYYCDETSFILKSNYLQSDYHWIICVPHFKTLWGPK